MSSRVAGAIVAGLLLLPGEGRAQAVGGMSRVPPVTVTRDAPPPRDVTPPVERPRTYVPPPPQRRDLFLAAPHTYSPSPRYDGLPRRFHQRSFPPVYGSYGGYGYLRDFYAPAPPMLASLPEERTPRSEPDGFLRLVVEPQIAQVYVDGYFVGTVAEFNGSLEPGPHRVALRADGFDPVTFDVRLFPNEIVTYRHRLVATGQLFGPAAPVTAPARSKTLYVIRRCYAGDTPPEAAQLPAGCDVTNVRRVPIS